MTSKRLRNVVLKHRLREACGSIAGRQPVNSSHTKLEGLPPNSYCRRRSCHVPLFVCRRTSNSKPASGRAYEEGSSAHAQSQTHVHCHALAHVIERDPRRFNSWRRGMDIKSKQTVQMTVSLPESSSPTTWTTPETNTRYYNYFSSSCHHLPPAPRPLDESCTCRWKSELPQSLRSRLRCPRVVRGSGWFLG